MVEGDRESNVLHKKLILDLESEGERVNAEKGRNERRKGERKEGVRSRNLTYVYQAAVVLTGLIAK